MQILLLEDLDTFAQAIQEGLAALRSELGEVSVTRIATEIDFRHRLEELARRDFDVAIFDVMVAWCTPEEVQTKEGANPPAEVMQEFLGEARWRSGIRCKHLFEHARMNLGLPRVPSIYYTVLEAAYLQTEVDDETPTVTKQGDVAALAREIRRTTSQPKVGLHSRTPRES